MMQTDLFSAAYDVNRRTADTNRHAVTGQPTIIALAVGFDNAA
jgi:hypothetical protein